MAIWNAAAWGDDKPQTGKRDPWVFVLITPRHWICMDRKALGASLEPAEALGGAGEGALVLDVSMAPRDAASAVARTAPQPDPRVTPGQIARKFPTPESVPADMRAEIEARLPRGVKLEEAQIVTNLDRVHPSDWVDFWRQVEPRCRVGVVKDGAIAWDDPGLRPNQAPASA